MQNKKINSAREEGVKRFLEAGKKQYKTDKAKEKFRKKNKQDEAYND